LTRRQRWKRRVKRVINDKGRRYVSEKGVFQGVYSVRLGVSDEVSSSSLYRTSWSRMVHLRMTWLQQKGRWTLEIKGFAKYPRPTKLKAQSSNGRQWGGRFTHGYKRRL
jgi:hypothetical protein